MAHANFFWVMLYLEAFGNFSKPDAAGVNACNINNCNNIIEHHIPTLCKNPTHEVSSIKCTSPVFLALFCQLATILKGLLYPAFLLYLFKNFFVLLKTFTACKVSKYWVFSGPFFPTFGLNTKRYGISLQIQSRKIRTIENPLLLFDCSSHVFSLWW